MPTGTDLRRFAPAPILIAEALRSEIQAGAITPGAPLRQEEVAARFGVSRIPVRDALLRLETEGLVELLPNRGAYVSKLSPAQIAEIYDLRILLECDLLKRAVAHIGAADIEDVERIAINAELEAKGRGWHALDTIFHERLYAPAERPRQLDMILGLRAAVHRYARSYEQLPEANETWLTDHRQILAAVKERNAKRAAMLLEDHLRRAQAFVLARLEANATTDE